MPHVSLETQERETRLLRSGVQGDCNDDNALTLGSTDESRHF
jgi:hypothetical protein